MNYQEEKLANFLESTGRNPINISEATRKMVESYKVTVGFTIEGLDRIIESLKFSVATPNQEKSILGWVFWFPNNPPEENDRRVNEISIEQLEITITDNESKLKRNPLLAFGSSESISLVPKIFYQPKEINGSPLDSPYSRAFDQTLPRFIVDNEAPVSALEEYENWTDFAFLPASELKNMRMMLSEDTIYSDVFFSGARINYATSHNPLMRNEQLTLPNKHTGEILAPESHLPFTLKLEYYVASDDNSKAWLRSPNEKGSQIPPPVSAPADDDDTSSLQRRVSIEKALEGETPTEASEAFMPGTYIIPPCPPVWIYPFQVARELQANYADIDTKSLIAFTEKVYSYLHKPNPGPDPTTINLPDLSLQQVLPPPVVVVPPPPKSIWQRLVDLWEAFVAVFYPSSN